MRYREHISDRIPLIIPMSSEQTSQQNSTLPAFAEAIVIAQQMQLEWIEHGVAFVDLYIEDVDGDLVRAMG